MAVGVLSADFVNFDFQFVIQESGKNIQKYPELIITTMRAIGDTLDHYTRPKLAIRTVPDNICTPPPMEDIFFRGKGGY
jgi:hypothetical protein